MKEYKQPEMEVIKVNETDVITTSCDTETIPM